MKVGHIPRQDNNGFTGLNRIKTTDEVGGDKDLTETLLCVLCPNVNYLSLLTDESISMLKLFNISLKNLE